MMVMMILIETHSGHCMMEDDKATSSKAFSTGLALFLYIVLSNKTKESLVITLFPKGASPQKDPVAKVGSRELVKKLISRDVQTEKYAGFNSSSSSEKVKFENSFGTNPVNCPPSPSPPES